MGFCSGMSRTYLMILNFITGLGGAILIAFGGYTLYELDEIPSDTLGVFYTAAPLVAGVLVLLLSFVGYCGAKNGNKCCLFFYGITMNLLLVILLVAGVGIVLSIDYVKTIGESSSLKLEKGVEKEINDFQAAIYNKCCVDKNFTQSAIKLCSDVDTEIKCVPGGPSDGLCTCIVDEGIYNRDYKTITDETCDGLNDAKVKVGYGSFNGGKRVPIVGSVDDGGCGEGNPKWFQRTIYEFIDKYGMPAGYLFIVVGLILQLGTIFSLVLMCSNSDQWNGNSHEQDYSRPQQQQTYGADMAGTGTGAPNYGATQHQVNRV